MSDCYVMIPLPDGTWATACFAEEFRHESDWRLTSDHIFPRSYFPELMAEDWNAHQAHFGCQRRQGGLVFAEKNGGWANVSLEQRSQAGLALVAKRGAWSNMTLEQRNAAGRKGGVALTASLTPEQLSERGRKGGRKGGVASATQRVRECSWARWWSRSMARLARRY
jgi:general stress protein YciG